MLFWLYYNITRCQNLSNRADSFCPFGLWPIMGSWAELCKQELAHFLQVVIFELCKQSLAWFLQELILRMIIIIVWILILIIIIVWAFWEWFSLSFRVFDNEFHYHYYLVRIKISDRDLGIIGKFTK